MSVTVDLRTSFARMKGLSMVELLSAVAIGLFMVVGAATVHVSSRSALAANEAVAQLQVDAHAAMRILESDIRMANYWGLSKDGAAIVNKPDQINASIPSASLIANTEAMHCGALHAINVEKYVEATNDSYVFPDACITSIPATKTADTLTIRRSGSSSAKLDAARLQICAARGNVAIILGTDCAGEIYNLLVNTYYIARSADSKIPSLWRKELGIDVARNAPAFRDIELIPGVEDMQVQLGVDSYPFSGMADSYLNPGTKIAADEQVVAVRVWLLFRTREPDPQYRDENVYVYGGRSADNGTTASLDSASSAAYVPQDNFHRVLVSRTVFIRNAIGT